MLKTLDKKLAMWYNGKFGASERARAAKKTPRLRGARTTSS